MTANTQPVSETLLANRELLSLDHARFFLVNRVRTKTPLGAAEFLGSLRSREDEPYKKRIEVAIDCLEIYRECFPEEYARSTSPFFSLQREHEFYRLVHSKLFPLATGDGTALTRLLEREPRAYLPFIPVAGLQEHVWEGGQFDFWEIELCFRLASVLSAQTGVGGRGWEALSMRYGLQSVAAPAPPLAAVGWSLFVNSCRVDETPLKYFPLAFDMITYKTGNPWLDLSCEGYAAVDWSMKQVAQLALMRQQADGMKLAIKALDIWLEENPQRGITRAVEFWNESSAKEEQLGYAGMYDIDLVEMGGLPLGNGMVAMPPGAFSRLQELEA